MNFLKISLNMLEEAKQRYVIKLLLRNIQSKSILMQLISQL